MSTVITALDRHCGTEALTVADRIKLWANEIDTQLTAINMKVFGKSIHVVEPNAVFARLKEGNNYFQLSTDFIPAPVHFDPKNQSFNEYVNLCINVVGLIKVTTDAIDEVYKVLKRAAVSGQVPFALRTSPHETLIEDLATKLDSVFQNTGKGTRQLSVLYPNFSEAEQTFHRYNMVIKTLHPRDPELLVSRTHALTDLVKVIRRKIETNDLIIDKDELTSIEIALKRIDTMVGYCGRLLSLCNELTRVFELQLAYFNKK